MNEQKLGKKQANLREPELQEASPRQSIHGQPPFLKKEKSHQGFPWRPGVQNRPIETAQ